ncbi:MAG: AAA family ATPase [Xanthomonadaceae bacterium]|nr:AAA family ATPase [Xanthomonadaceae bacterium]
MKPLIHLSLAALSFWITTSTFAQEHRYERMVKVRIEKEELRVRITAKVKSEKNTSVLNLEFKDPRDNIWTQFMLFTDVNFKKIVYSEDKDSKSEVKYNIELEAVKSDELLKADIGTTYFDKNNNLKSIYVETIREKILQDFPKIFVNNSSTNPTVAANDSEVKNSIKIKKKTEATLLSNNTIEFEGKKFRIELSDKSILKLFDEKGRFLIVTQNLNSSFFDRSLTPDPFERSRIVDGILRFDTVERAIDLRQFDAEIDLIGHSQKFSIVRDAQEKTINVPQWMDEQFPDLVEIEREKIKNGTEADINDIYSEFHMDILSTFANGKSVKLIGDPGVGKSTLIKILARAIAKGTLPNVPRTLQIRAVSTSKLVAGTKYVGSDAIRMQSLISYAQQVRPAYFIDEFHTMSGAGVYEGNTTNNLNTIKAELETGLLRLIAASTPHEWDNAYATDTALNQRFTKVTAHAPSGEVLLTTIRNAYKLIGKDAPEQAIIEKAIELSNQYSISGAQPRIAINLLLAAGQIKGRNSGSWKAGVADMGSLLEATKKTYNLDPANFDSAKASELIKKLEKLLREEVIGQAEAINKTLDLWLKRFAGVHSKDYADSMILMGPPGVGKTFISKLSSVALGYNYKLIEMNKYKSPHSVEEFRYEVYMAQLKSPATIFTFDEIEKADPAVQNAALSMLQPGQFTVNFKDSYGKFVFEEVRCHNAVFLMTTNAGQGAVTYKPVGFGGKSNVESTQPKRSSNDLRKALVAGGIAEPLISRTGIVVALDLPNRAEFEDALKKAVTKTIKFASGKKSRPITLSNEKEMMAFYMNQFVEGQSDYRTISEYIQDQLDLWIAREIVMSESKKQTTQPIIIKWSPWVSGQGVKPCEKAIGG